MFWVHLVTAVYFVWMGTCMHTENLLSGVLFKFVPMLLGIIYGFTVFTQLM